MPSRFISRLRRLWLALLLALLPATAPAAKRVIFDTDFRTDVDDAGTLAMLHELQDRGDAEILGVIVTTAGNSVVGAIDAVNTYYARPALSIGVIAAGLATGGGDEYAPTLANTALFPSDQTTATAPNSTTLYRSLLAAAPDGSVTIVVAGGQNAIDELMQSGANHLGDSIAQTGMQLIQAKVAELVIMGGHFTDPIYGENNIKRGITAAQQVAANWPTRVVYSGWEIGAGVKTGAALTNPAVNPVAKAYEVFSGSGPVGTIGDRDSWDQTAALYAVVGLTFETQPLWTLSAPQTITFDAQGRTIQAPNPGGNRYYLVQQMSDSGLAAVISSLMTGVPIPPPPPPPGDTIAWYHFDEAAGASFVNYGSAGPALDLTNTGGPNGRDNTGPGGYGAASFPRYGSAFDVLGAGNGTYHATASAVGGGATTTGNVTQSDLQGANGAFTYEAIIKLTGTTTEQNILSHDGDGTNRGFLFRVNAGKLALYTGTVEVTANLPTAGPHVFSSSAWFHVAVTYSGEEGVANNISFYWTRLVTGAAAANLIGTSTLAADLTGSISNKLGIGTTTRAPFRFEPAGLVDEVRLSSLAHAASDFAFLWGPPDTDQDGIPDYWELEHHLDPLAANAATDHEHDGVPDLVEFALNLDPEVPGVTGLPVAAIEDGYLTLTVAKNPDATNLIYRAEVSEDLTTWLFGSENVTVIEDTPALLKVRDKVPVTGTIRRQMRVQVMAR